MAGEAEAGKDQLTDSQVVPTGELKGPEDEGSLADIMEKAQPITFTGHPALGEDDAAGEGDEPGPDGGEKPPEDTAGEVDGNKAEVTPSKPEKPEKKYKSWEEAEAGATEHQSFATKKAEEAAREKEAREKAEQEAAELRQKLAEKEAAKPPEKPPVEVKPVTPEESASKIETALEEIGRVAEPEYPDDPYNAEAIAEYNKKYVAYRKKVAMAWAKAGLGAGTGIPMPSQEEITESVTKKVMEELDAKKAAEDAAVAEKNRKIEADRAWKDAVELAGKSGLDMKEGSTDYRLFDSFSREMPPEVDEKPFDQQVEWVVGEVRRSTGKVIETAEEARARALKAQQDNTVLERGGNKTPVKTQTEPYTLGSILNTQERSRRI